MIAAAITSRQDKNRLPTHIGVRANRCGLAKDSIVLTEQIRTLDKRRLRERAGRIPEDDMRRVDEALGVSMGLHNAGIRQMAAAATRIYTVRAAQLVWPPSSQAMISSFQMPTRMTTFRPWFMLL